ncbi:TonB-dependent receptor [Rufibacter psychrotolerans]|uniref:TonB-dependent receptor n=1 Tax=Rufibacter psychrotolerans TaxID=2812556 RepID=UPI00196789F2|nr:TonB-dependent receptor [Rufibacter sp. SYSU D00308]
MLQRVLFFAGLLCGMGLLASPALHAQTHLPDTVHLHEVRVAVPRYTRYAAGARVQTVDTLLLKRQPGITLAEVLQQRSPLYLKSYGNGMLATVTFRGTSASHTAVLWNGFNIALPTLGESDFALLPPSPNTTVALQHGASGALHGTGAIGGAVVLENPVTFTPRQTVRVQQEWGSFGHSRTAASGSFSNGRLALTTAFTRTAADNDFRFRNTTAFGAPLETQQNAAFDQNSFAQELHYKLNQEQRLSVRGWYVKTHRQVQPSMGSANNHAEQDDENLRLMGEWQGQLAGGTTTVRAAWFRDQLDYREAGTPSLSLVHTYQSQVEHERQLLPHLLVQAGAEGQLFRAQVGGYGTDKEEKRFSAYSWLRYDPVPRLQLSLNVRQAWVEGFNPPLTPTLGANFQLVENPQHTLSLKGNVSRSYRVPTLNNRFWVPGGNPDLKPEAGWGYEGGLAHHVKTGGLSGTTEVTVYAQQVKDWIQWRPADRGGYPEAVNLSKVRGHGLELDTRWQYQPLPHWTLTAGLAYAYTVSRQQLPDAGARLQDRQLFYVPKHKVASWAEVRHQGWWLTADATFTGQRFTDNDNNNWLEPYALVNASLGKSFAWRSLEAQLMAQVHNLTNTVYQTMAYRAMPPRSFRLALSLQWAKANPSL